MIPSPDKTHTVEGILVFGHTMMDRFRLDQFEGSVSAIPFLFLECVGILSARILKNHPIPFRNIPGSCYQLPYTALFQGRSMSKVNPNL
jgi:hypothetical protein